MSFEGEIYYLIHFLLKLSTEYQLCARFYGRCGHWELNKRDKALPPKNL
jgi:hypothetical protein